MKINVNIIKLPILSTDTKPPEYEVILKATYLSYSQAEKLYALLNKTIEDNEDKLF